MDAGIDNFVHGVTVTLGSITVFFTAEKRTAGVFVDFSECVEESV